jgi:hypothetical protein
MLVQLILGATTSGLAYLILAGGLIAKADVYLALRNRAVTLSSDIFDKLRERIGSHSAS